jgi:hypothetical protein
MGKSLLIFGTNVIDVLDKDHAVLNGENLTTA